MNRLIVAFAIALVVASCGGADTASGRGEALVQDLGCVTCHTDDANALGPPWVGVAGSERPLDDGSSVVADEAYLIRSIVEPGEDIVAGWRPAMPMFFLSDTEVDDIVAYLLSLSGDALVPTMPFDEE
ncbi:MAG: cytochrome c [Acidimicrobiia bacterium]|nr:cytochrome c [Acidimicrobiia bacterium]